jgi:hypothetical protein
LSAGISSTAATMFFDCRSSIFRTAFDTGFVSTAPAAAGAAFCRAVASSGINIKTIAKRTVVLIALPPLLPNPNARIVFSVRRNKCLP